MLVGAVSLQGYFTEYERFHYIIELNCTGNESSIWNCSYSLLSENGCNGYDASVYCQGIIIIMSIIVLNNCIAISTPMDDCADGDVRLVGGSTEYEGRVEVCINRAWGTICSRYYGWSTSDINVVCRQLGHQGLGMKTAYKNNDLSYILGSYPYYRFEPGVGPIFMSYVQCSGTESNLLECSYRQSFQYSYCSHSVDAGLSCEGTQLT